MTSSSSAADGQRYGQSIWFDGLTRELIKTGELQRLIDDQGVVGVTMNPATLERAIGEGLHYDDAIRDLLELDAGECLDRLFIDDVQKAADILRPIYDRTDGVDGYVSFDMSATVAQTPEARLSEARRLFEAVNRPNAMIKILGRPSNLTPIEEALFAGVNVNVMLLFSVRNYAEVAECYIHALERRLIAGLPVDRIASVASISLSPIDATIDKNLENNIRAAQMRGDLARVGANNHILGKVGIATAKAAYRRFQELSHSDRFAPLREAGARVQRLAWLDVTPTNAAYSVAMYLDALVGPETVAMLSKPTLPAFAKHKPEAPTLLQGMEEGLGTLARLNEVGIDLDVVARQLQGDSVDAFIEAFNKLIARVEGKRKSLISGYMSRQKLVLGRYRSAVETEIKRLRGLKAITRTWAIDATLWKDTPEHVKSITSRLGWLTVASDGRIDRGRLSDLRDESRRLGWKHVVLLGMGGSSLAPEVLWKVFGQQDGFPALLVLDSTDPESIHFVEKTVDLAKTVFIVASKSGTTIETLSMQRYFYEKYKAKGGDHFIAITDPGSKLEGWAGELSFRHTVLNPADIGGRYSALSYFGMVPAALIGLNFEAILDKSVEMQNACGSNVMGVNHPGLWLGTVMGVLAQQGRDKLTILSSPEIASFGDWAEQLIAESTGKEGKGIIPVTGAPAGAPREYDDDRLFVYLRLDGSTNNPDAQVKALQEAGQPVVTLEMRDKSDIGAEFFRWEYATSVAGIVFGINPFDEPNVTESKENTSRLLAIHKQEGRLPEELPALTEDGLSLYANGAMASLLRELAEQHHYEASELESLIAAFFTLARPGDYISLMAYLRQSPEAIKALETVRARVRATFRRAVTLGFGPRFLHSTGQLHKGGPNRTLFVQFTVADADDPPIPKAPYGFATLKQAQAAGDIQALQNKGRLIIRLHMANGLDKGLKKLAAAIHAAAEKRK